MTVPIGVSAPECVILDENGNPLTMNGALVQMTLASCGPAGCRVDSLHPPPAGERWYQFNSQVLVSAAGAGTRDWVVKYHFASPSECQAFHGKTVDSWFTDDRDRRYGIVVHEAFRSTVPVPLMPRSGMIVLILALVGMGAFCIWRPRHAPVT